ncbi:MAG: aspartate 1-decarboxylase [Planctomycetota bacterium]
MFREILRVKIHGAIVTATELNYSGSITLDPKLVDAAGFIGHEKVQILNLNNGARFDTFVIRAKKNTGKICLNGPAARLGQPGDKIHILSYAFVENQETNKFKTKFVFLNEKNLIKKLKEVSQK